MPLSKEKIEQIWKDAKDFCPIRIKGPTYSYNIYKKRNAYISGATAEAEKALCLIEALEKIEKESIVGWQEKTATTALQSYSKK